MENRDLMQVSLVAQLQREAGTNAAEVIDQVASNVRNQMELRRLVKTLTAQGRMSRWIVSILPAVLFGALYVLNRDYLRPLWETAGGKTALIYAGGTHNLIGGQRPADASAPDAMRNATDYILAYAAEDADAAARIAALQSNDMRQVMRR